MATALDCKQPVKHDRHYVNDTNRLTGLLNALNDLDIFSHWKDHSKCWPFVLTCEVIGHPKQADMWWKTCDGKRAGVRGKPGYQHNKAKNYQII